MADFQTTVSNIESLRLERTQIERQIDNDKEYLKVVEREFTTLNRLPGGASSPEAAALLDQINELQTGIDSNKALLEGVRNDLVANADDLATTDPTVLIRQLKDGYPLMLLPVRVETRFMKVRTKTELTKPAEQISKDVTVVNDKIEGVERQLRKYSSNSVPELGKIETEVIPELDAIKTTVDGFNELAVFEKQRLESSHQVMTESVAGSTERLQSYANSVQNTIDSIQSLLESINTGSSNLQTKVDAIKTKPTPPPAVRDTTMRDFNTTLVSLNESISKHNQKNVDSSEQLLVEQNDILSSVQKLLVKGDAVKYKTTAQESEMLNLHTQMQANLLDFQARTETQKQLEVQTKQRVDNINININERIGDIGVKIPIIEIKPAPTPNIDFVDTNELWVRIYPDDVAIHTHEEMLTQDEIEMAKKYWETLWAARGDKDAELSEWRLLVGAYGAERAAWIVKAMTPSNYSLRTPNNVFNDVVETLTNVIEKLDALAVMTPFSPSDVVQGGDNLISQINNANTQLNQISVAFPEEIKGVTNIIKEISATKRSLDFINEFAPITDKGIVKGVTTGIQNAINNLSATIGRILPSETIDETNYDEEPVFPDLQPKESTWSQSPRSYVMPDNFVVTLYKGGNKAYEVVGNSIPDPLIVGVDPQSEQALDSVGEEIEVESDIKWMTDFEEAVKVGMAVRIVITQEEAAHTNANSGFDKVMVLGVKFSSNHTESQKLVEQLIDNHHYSSGFSLLPQGTATNNTDKDSSGYTKFEPDAEISFNVERKGPLFTFAPNQLSITDGQMLSRAIGIEEPVLQNIRYSNAYDMSDAVAINHLLWQGTLGTYLEDMFDKTLLVKDIQKLRDFFGTYVRGRGYLSSFRVDDQPYGILPTTAFSRFNWQDPLNKNNPTADEIYFNTLKKVLVDYLDTKLWKSIISSPNFKNVDSAFIDKKSYQDNFVKLLGQEASALEYYQRYSTAQGFFGNFSNTLSKAKNRISDSTWDKNAWEAVKNEFDSFFSGLFSINKTADFGNHLNSEIFKTVFLKNEQLLRGKLIDDLPLSETRTIAGTNYLQYLKNNRLEKIKNDITFKNEPSNSLFYLILRHSLFMQYWDAAMNILLTAEKLNPETTPGTGDRKLYKYYLNAGTATVPPRSRWFFLFSPLAGLRGTNNQIMTMAEFLQSTEIINYKQETKHLREMFEALDVLSRLSTASLERVFAEHIDLCSYRLDAWELGMANKRLDTLRKKNQYRRGLYIGAYGWLENLKPGAPRTDVNGNAIIYNYNEGVETPIAKDPENQGYIHAPSLAHAVTSAVLRNGYLSHADETSTNDAMAVNLSSERVRRAMFFVEGMRSGQTLSALLGYQFEKGLQDRGIDANLNQYILDIRLKYPLVANKLKSTEVTGESIESLEATNVVDGLALLKAKEVGYPYGVNTLPADGTDSANEIKAEVDRLADSMDAVSDLALAESVYQVSKGNFEYSDAMMKAISKSSTIPEPEIVKTPRTGHGITQRVTINFNPIRRDSLTITNPWNTIPMTPRAISEPSINNWLGKIIGDPSKIKCIVRYVDSSEVENTIEITAAEFNLQPIDFLSLINKDTDITTSSELSKLISYYVRTLNNLSDDVELTINYRERESSWDSTIKTFFEVAPLISNLITLIGKSRELSADDLIFPGSAIQTTTGGNDIDELFLRITNNNQDGAFDTLQLLHNSLISERDLLANETDFSSPIFSDVRDLLMTAYNYDVSQSLPDSSSGGSEAIKIELLTKLDEAIRIISAKITRAEKLLEKYKVDGSKEQNTDILIQVLKAIFSSSFVITPLFYLHNPDELQIAWNEKPTVDFNKMDKWFKGIARVRKNMFTLEQTSTMHHLFEQQEVNLTPVQLTTSPLSYWAGGDYPENPDPNNPSEQPPTGDVLSLVMHLPENFSFVETNGEANYYAGLLVDDWVELIPSKEETTGIAFHYDQPNAKPPQTILLAVTPELTGSWTWSNLSQTVIETMEMAKKRAVTPNHLVDSNFHSYQNLFTQVLPGVMAEITKQNTNISKDLSANIETSVF